MARPHEERNNSFNEAERVDRLIEAVEHDDQAEIQKLRSELSAREEGSLLEFEHRAEDAARERRDGERTLDRIRNVVQAILLNRRLRPR